MLFQSFQYSKSEVISQLSSSSDKKFKNASKSLFDENYGYVPKRLAELGIEKNSPLWEDSYDVLNNVSACIDSLDIYFRENIGGDYFSRNELPVAVEVFRAIVLAYPLSEWRQALEDNFPDLFERQIFANRWQPILNQNKAAKYFSKSRK